jgi:hypothetical protein
LIEGGRGGISDKRYKGELGRKNKGVKWKRGIRGVKEKVVI